MTLGFWHFLHDGGRISVSERGGEERWLDGQWDAGWRSTPGHNYDSLNQSWLPTTGRMLFIISIDLHSQHETWLSMAFKILQRKKTKRIITKLSISSFQTLHTTTYVSINVALWMKSKEGILSERQRSTNAIFLESPPQPRPWKYSLPKGTHILFKLFAKGKSSQWAHSHHPFYMQWGI